MFNFNVVEREREKSIDFLIELRLSVFNEFISLSRIQHTHFFANVFIVEELCVNNIYDEFNFICMLVNM